MSLSSSEVPNPFLMSPLPLPTPPHPFPPLPPHLQVPDELVVQRGAQTLPELRGVQQQVAEVHITQVGCGLADGLRGGEVSEYSGNGVEGGGDGAEALGPLMYTFPFRRGRELMGRAGHMMLMPVAISSRNTAQAVLRCRRRFQGARGSPLPHAAM